MTELFYEVYGDSSEYLILIDSALGSCSAEWRHIAKDLSNNYKVVIYDRAGYGKSKHSEEERTPTNIVNDINNLIDKVQDNQKLILVGHSQGGYYISQFALQYTDKVSCLILLDPATPFDDEFKVKLTQKEYLTSGVDKAKGLNLGKIITGLGLGNMLKGLFRKQPPFCYYKFTKADIDDMLKSLCSKYTYITALNELKYTHDAEKSEDLKMAIQNQSLNNLPVVLITHSSEVYIKELQSYANMQTDQAQKIEMIWQEIMTRMMKLSSNCEHIVAQNSGHFIHLSDYNLLKDTMKSLIIKSI